MAVIVKMIAVFFWLSATAVALHFVFTPLYENVMNIGEMWGALNIVMAIAVLGALGIHLYRKLVLDKQGADAGITREYLETNLLVYLSVALTLWFSWNWIDDLTIYPDVQSSVRLTLWSFINPLFVIVAGVTGCYLWRCQCFK